MITKVNVELDAKDLADAIALYVAKQSAGDGPEIKTESIRFYVGNEGNARTLNEITVTATT